MDLAGLPGSLSYPAQVNPRKVKGHNVLFGFSFYSSNPEDYGQASGDIGSIAARRPEKLGSRPQPRGPRRNSVFVALPFFRVEEQEEFNPHCPGDCRGSVCSYLDSDPVFSLSPSSTFHHFPTHPSSVRLISAIPPSLCTGSGAA
ncbi:hypothetical protein D4764_19G0008600 [Takifugu flavidus]|uniref:Uncharacterized protein n=1 Tax=Takifugu flavidus TaxID=433684 RepID=A0A5C6NR40_9TELE|nr:hypothetical protein D4764_19G0008600 [Takifugu flavidus]